VARRKAANIAKNMQADDWIGKTIAEVIGQDISKDSVKGEKLRPGLPTTLSKKSECLTKTGSSDPVSGR
jgi:hypothetical protein